VAQSKQSKLEKAKRELVKLIEEVANDFRLAGDAHYIKYEFGKALNAYEESLQYVTKQEIPTLWADMQILIGNANNEMAIRSEGPAIHHYRKAAFAAYQESLTVYTKDQFPQAWAGVQNNLGNTLTAGHPHRRRGRAPVARPGRRRLPRGLRSPSPRTFTGALGPNAEQPRDTYLYLANWSHADEVYQSLLAAYPEYANAYAQALSTYHDRLFAYAKAFEVGTHWVGRHPDDINAQANLAEAHLATGRFQEAETRLASLISNPSSHQARPPDFVRCKLRTSSP
jgi:tetratricopeptide (TPR) repeat protein